MGKPQFVLKNDAAIVQALGLISQRIEGIGEAVREVEVRHAYAEGCRVKLDGKASLVERMNEGGRKGCRFFEEWRVRLVASCWWPADSAAVALSPEPTRGGLDPRLA